MYKPIRVLRQESHMWPEPANTFLLEDRDGAILIDAGCGKLEARDRLRSYLSSYDFAFTDVHTIVLTHAHPDHMGAVPYILEESSPRIVLHPLEVSLAREPQLLNDSFDMCHITKYYGEFLGEADRNGVDVIEYFSALCPMGEATTTDTMVDGDVLELGGHEFEVVHTPGHAPGHVCLFEHSTGILLTGDMVGEVVAWYCPSGGGVTGYLDSLDRLEALGATRIMPSHGADITDPVEAIRATREFLVARENRIIDLLSEGEKSLVFLTDEIFPPAARLFPGLQVIDSHLIKLEKEGLVTRSGEPSRPVFRLN